VAAEEGVIVGINTLQIAWLSRLADKGVISPGQSIVEFSPQDIYSTRPAIKKYALRHNPPDTVDRMLDDIFDGETPRADRIPEFYRLFGIDRYRSMDLFDTRVDWKRDFNKSLRLRERFDVATNFGTAEHVFNIGQLFHSIHDAIRPGGVALHVLPTFGDINHGFYNVHPTIYFDLAAANNYTIEDICYVDRWDIRNKMLLADLEADFDFDALPIQVEHMRNGARLQRMVTDQFVANYNDPDTQRYGASYPSILYDYCVAALRKNHARAFRFPMQGFYGGNTRVTLKDYKSRFVSKIQDQGYGWIPGAMFRRIRRLWKAVG
jgi:SAM-dependent methyltransferase